MTFQSWVKRYNHWCYPCSQRSSMNPVFRDVSTHRKVIRHMKFGGGDANEEIQHHHAENSNQHSKVTQRSTHLFNNQSNKQIKLWLRIHGIPYCHLKKKKNASNRDYFASSSVYRTKAAWVNIKFITKAQAVPYSLTPTMYTDYPHQSGNKYTVKPLCDSDMWSHCVTLTCISTHWVTAGLNCWASSCQSISVSKLFSKFTSLSLKAQFKEKEERHVIPDSSLKQFQKDRYA